jgi:hypothetical protein
MKVTFVTLLLLVSIAPVASADCWGCGLPPGASGYQCMLGTYNGGTACGYVLGQCVPAGTCIGPSGEECTTSPHCGPQQKWTSKQPARPQQWQLASVEIIRPEAASAR